MGSAQIKTLAIKTYIPRKPNFSLKFGFLFKIPVLAIKKTMGFYSGFRSYEVQKTCHSRAGIQKTSVLHPIKTAINSKIGYLQVFPGKIGLLFHIFTFHPITFNPITFHPIAKVSVFCFHQRIVVQIIPYPVAAIS